MRIRPSVAAGLTLLSSLCASAGPARAGEGDRRSLDPKVFSLRLLLGIGDPRPQPWDGKVAVDRGEVVGLEGWRFRKGDRVDGAGWQARSCAVRKKAAPAKDAEAASLRPDRVGSAVAPNGVVVTLRAPDDATLTVRTEQGEFAVPLAELADGSPRRYLGGRAEARRLPPSIPLRDGATQEDQPAAASDARGASWIAFIEHTPRGPEVLEALAERPRDFSAFVPTGGGDQVRLIRFADGKAGEPIDVTGPGRDAWRPAVAVDAEGGVVVAWTENRDANWDLYSRRYDPGRQAWSEPRRLTTRPGTDTDVALAAAPGGKVWMAWQNWNDGQADIVLALLDEPDRIVNIASSPANEWAPSLAVDRSGAVHVAYDTSEAGQFDVMLRSLSADGSLGRAVPVAASGRFEARPSVAVDPSGRVWIAYEERDENWGKDSADLSLRQGSALYRSSAVRVRCLDGGRLLDAPDPVAGGPEPVRTMNSFARLAADRSGRIWLAFRHREEVIWGNNAVMVVGGVWFEYVTSLAGPAWAPPQILPRSDGLLDSRPALVAPADGPALIVYGGDGRMRHEVEFTADLSRRIYTHAGTPAGVSNHDLQVAALVPATAVATVDPRTIGPANDPPAGSRPPAHADEAADVARMRNHRIRAGGKTYRLLRGEFHRHTEISLDGGNDGALEDMWRYALDAAHLDWIGNGDHDSGGSKEYTWWLIQKTTDLYHNPPGFSPMFTYERSVSYPGGHRNVMFPRRGVRTLPRLVGARGGVKSDVDGKDEDAEMLYAYLHELGGICAAHTTGTGAGTDWRANDPEVEPFVEIFQGFRNSYEHLGAPRADKGSGRATKPFGMVWNALALQYRLGFQSSSDHISTHTSYGVAIAEENRREAIFDAFKKRRCYAATDNILLDVRIGDHLMGEEFAADGPVTLRVLAHGTGPIERIDIIKDFAYVYSTEPRTARASFSWTDEERRPPGLSWYYVRVIQEDGGLAWGSPIWVRTRGSNGR